MSKALNTWFNVVTSISGETSKHSAVKPHTSAKHTVTHAWDCTMHADGPCMAAAAAARLLCPPNDESEADVALDVNVVAEGLGGGSGEGAIWFISRSAMDGGRMFSSNLSETAF